MRDLIQGYNSYMKEDDKMTKVIETIKDDIFMEKLEKYAHKDLEDDDEGDAHRIF